MAMETNINAPRSGSRDWEHTPNLTPRGYEIKKDELYVLSGDTLIKAYHLLASQKMNALLTAGKLQPTQVADLDDFLSMVKYINITMYHVLHSVPLANILQMQEEARLAEQEKQKKSTENPIVKEGLTLKEILDKFHLSDGGNKDEIPPSPPKSDEGAPNET
jgi:hypothetical protein